MKKFIVTTNQTITRVYQIEAEDIDHAYDYVLGHIDDLEPRQEIESDEELSGYEGIVEIKNGN